MTNADIREITSSSIGALNPICAHHTGADAPWLPDAISESEQAFRQAEPRGRRIFGAFENGQAVGRVEVMPIDLAPLPLKGENLFVIRCLWVVKEAQGKGYAKALLAHALDADKGIKGVAIVAVPGWNDVPISFLTKQGFEAVQQAGVATLLLRKASPDAQVAFAPVRKELIATPSRLHVETVISGMCPAATQYYRRLLDIARNLSDKVLTKETIVRNRADAIRCGRENTILIDGQEPLQGPVRTAAFSDLIRTRLAALQ